MLDTVRVFPGKTFAFINYVAAEDAVHAKQVSGWRGGGGQVNPDLPMYRVTQGMGLSDLRFWPFISDPRYWPFLPMYRVT